MARFSMDLARLIWAHDYNSIYSLKNDNRLIAIAEEMSKATITEKSVVSSVFLMSKGEMKRRAKKFYERFSLHNVPYASKKDVNNTLNSLANSSMTVDEQVDIYNDIGKIVSPFDLPIRNKNSYSAALAKWINVSNSPEFLMAMKIYFKYIIVESDITCFTVGHYIHEIAHTQTERKGSVSEYAHSEVISQLLENIFYFEIGQNILGSAQYMNCEYLNDYINLLMSDDCTKEEEFVCSKYIVSSLETYQLLRRYIKGSGKERRLMLCGVQLVFDGEITIDEFLEFYGITINNSLKRENVRKSLKLFL